MNSDHIFLQSLEAKLAFVKDSRLEFPVVSASKSDSVVTGTIFTLHFPSRDPIHIWFGVNHTRLRFCILLSHASSTSAVGEVYSQALIDARQLGWTIHTSLQNRVYDANEKMGHGSILRHFFALQGNLLISPETNIAGAQTPTSQGMYHVIESAHMIQTIISTMCANGEACPDFVMPGDHYSPCINKSLNRPKPL